MPVYAKMKKEILTLSTPFSAFPKTLFPYLRSRTYLYYELQ